LLETKKNDGDSCRPASDKGRGERFLQGWRLSPGYHLFLSYSSAAIKLYTDCINLDDENATFYLNRAAALMMTRDFQRAIMDGRKVLSLDPNSVKAYFRVAKCYMNLGNVRESIQQLKQAQALFSGKSTSPQSEAAIAKELKNAEDINEKLEKYDAFFANGEFEDALKQLDMCCLLVDPALTDKQDVFSSSQSRLNDVDLINISLKWRVMRADCFIGSRHLDEANLIAVKVLLPLISKVLMADKTNSEALVIRATVQFLLESHPMTAVIALVVNALAYDPDNELGRLLMRKVLFAQLTLSRLGQGNRDPQK
jgi:DnaJ family protein C protein 7